MEEVISEKQKKCHKNQKSLNSKIYNKAMKIIQKINDKIKIICHLMTQ